MWCERPAINRLTPADSKIIILVSGYHKNNNAYNIISYRLPRSGSAVCWPGGRAEKNVLGLSLEIAR